jgi:anti-sigma factor RsiW
MSDCREFEPLLTPFVDGEAGAAERAAVDAHLRSCPHCRDLVASERAIRDAFASCRASFHAHASDGLRRRCEAARAASSAPPVDAIRRRSWVPLSMAATLVLAVAGVFLYGLNGGTEALAAQLAVDHVKCFEFSKQPTVLPDATTLSREWSAARGWTIKIPATTELEGLELLEMRRCISTQGQTAHLMYRWRGQPLSVYVLNSHAARVGPDPQIVDQLGQEEIIWSKGGRTYAIVTRGHPPDLERVAQYVRAAAE